MGSKALRAFVIGDRCQHDWSWSVGNRVGGSALPDTELCSQDRALKTVSGTGDAVPTSQIAPGSLGLLQVIRRQLPASASG